MFSNAVMVGEELLTGEEAQPFLLGIAQEKQKETTALVPIVDKKNQNAFDKLKDFLNKPVIGGVPVYGVGIGLGALAIVTAVLASSFKGRKKR